MNRKMLGLRLREGLRFKKKNDFFMSMNPKYDKYEIGEFTYGVPSIAFDHGPGTLKIGKYCSISDNVRVFLGGEHRADWVTTFPFPQLFEEARHITGHPRSKGDVIIGNDVWIGLGVTILSGVTIGDGAVVGAMSVVAKDVKPYEIVGGNPAKHIKNRFSDELIRMLLDIKWWDWDHEKIKANMDILLQGDIDAFCRKFHSGA